MRTGPAGHALRRTAWTIKPSLPGFHEAEKRELIGHPLPALADGDEILRIEVTNLGLTKVTCAGINASNLVEAKLNAGFNRQDFQGEFGTFNNKSSAVYRSVNYFLFERSDP